MTNAKVGQIFQEALDRPEAERAAYLDHACGGDTELRAQVDKLLAALEEAGSFFAEPKSEEAGEQAGAVIDRYKLLQEIGEGGMGVVWMAEQQEPVRRKVALKVIKLGMDTRQVVARFEAERQALAMMDHPNIAKVLDGGATPQGRPYFVMELVKGVPLTEYCDQANLNATERLELFQRVCHAVQHAHQKGVIHRDLKPGNILVTKHDGVAMPKVIDFGIAKATSAELTQRTLFTEFREMIGTPEYMAPEQAEMTALDVDTRADVYSLGVVLYEVLTGTKPFEIAKVLEKGYAEMMRVIREDDPPKPSTRVSTLGESLASVAQRRHTTPAALGRLMRGDLDWIVMRALEKDRGRRYATASDLAADIGRHLSHEPVQAGPPSASYRLHKYVRRNRVTVIAGAMVCGALIFGLTAATWGFLEAVDQRDRAIFAEKEAGQERDAADDARELAVTEKERADGEADKAREAAQRAITEAARATMEADRANTVLDLVNEMLGSANPERLKGPNYTVRQVLADFERGLGDRLKDQPEVEATLRLLIGRTYAGLGVYRTGEVSLRRALTLMQAAPEPSQHMIAETLASLAAVSGSLTRFAEAEDLLRRAIAIELASDAPDPAYCASLRARRSVHVAELGKLEEAEAMARRAVAKLEGVAGIEPDRLARGRSALSHVLVMAEKFDEAKSVAREAWNTNRSLLGEKHPQTSQSLATLAHAYYFAGDFEEAERAYERSLEIDREMVGEQHPNIGIGLGNLGRLRIQQKRHPEALTQFEQSLELLRASVGTDHMYTFVAISDLAVCLGMLHRFEDAADRARESLAIQERVGATPFQVSRNYKVLGEAERWRGRYGESEAALLRAVELLKMAHGDHRIDLSIIRRLLAKTLAEQGRLEQAEQMMREVVEDMRLRGETDHPEYVSSRVGLAEQLLQQCKQGRLPRSVLQAKQQEALRILRETLARQKETLPANDTAIARTLGYLSWAILPAGGVAIPPEIQAERESLLLQSLDIIRAAGKEHMQMFRESHKGLGNTYSQLRRWDEAAAMYRRALELAEQHGAGLPELVEHRSNLGFALLNLRSFKEAEKLIRQVIDGREQLGQPEDPYDWNFLTAAIQGQVPSAAAAQSDRFKELLEVMKKSIELEEGHLPVGHPMAGNNELIYAQAMFDMNRMAEAAQSFRHAIPRLPASRKRGPAWTGTLASFALSLLLTEEFVEAEPIARQCHDIRVAAIPDSWLRYNAMSLLGGALLGQGKFEAAEPLLIEGFEKMEPPAKNRNRLIQAHERIVKLYEKWGREEEAAKWRKKAPEAQKK